MKTFKEGLAELKTALKPMTWQEKIGHLWTYYKGFFFAAVAVVAGISIVVNAFLTKDPIFQGMTLNLVLSEEAKTYLTDDWKAVMKGKEKDRVVLELLYNTDDAIAMGQDAMFSDMMASIFIASGDMDYVMLDMQAMNELVTAGAFCDLREVLKQEQLEQLGKQICYYQDENQNTYPIAVDISDWEFSKNHLAYTEKVFLAFPGNTENTALLDDFLDYVWKWEKPQ